MWVPILLLDGHEALPMLLQLVQLHLLDGHEALPMYPMLALRHLLGEAAVLDRKVEKKN
jgi:hypothetical protein